MTVLLAFEREAWSALLAQRTQTVAFPFFESQRLWWTGRKASASGRKVVVPSGYPTWAVRRAKIWRPLQRVANA